MRGGPTEHVLAVSTGCPASIGPEISIAAAIARPSLRMALVGDEATLRRAAERAGAGHRVQIVKTIDDVSKLDAGALAVVANVGQLEAAATFGRPDAACGRAQLAYVDEALRLVRDEGAAALVTAAVSKHAIATSGAKHSKHFRGHTEHLQEQLGAEEVVMAFASERLVTSLVTTHLPLRKVARAIDKRGVAKATFWLGKLLSDLGHARPRVAVAGLNPHAGEGGLLGDEEIDVIEKGIALAKKRLSRAAIDAVVEGPLGAESAYRLAVKGSFDGVVAMYHDQATIPMKVLSFGEAVNITLGLPIVRTSVDHGTGYDLAGKGVASPEGMIAAIDLAHRLTSPRARAAEPRDG